MTDVPALHFSNNVESHRYEAHQGDTLAAYVEYSQLANGVLFSHTEVVPAFEGKGVGSAIARHVLDSARQLEPARIVVVVGHGAERVKQAFEGQADLHFALQQPQQGTGHAVQQAVPLLLEGDGKDDVTLVLYGDVPLTRAEWYELFRAAGYTVP